jgi:Tol biopolymer transport system component
LVAHDTNDAADIFVWDQRTHVTRRVSVFPGSVQSEGSTNRGYSRHASISAGGRFVAFGSIATNLVRNDTNNFYDVFVRDRRAHTTRRVSVGPGGAQANGTCLHLAMSANGRHVTFDSFASNLVSPERRHHELQAFVNQRER